MRKPRSLGPKGGHKEEVGRVLSHLIQDSWDWGWRRCLSPKPPGRKISRNNMEDKDWGKKRKDPPGELSSWEQFEDRRIEAPLRIKEVPPRKKVRDKVIPSDTNWEAEAAISFNILLLIQILCRYKWHACQLTCTDKFTNVPTNSKKASPPPPPPHLATLVFSVTDKMLTLNWSFSHVNGKFLKIINMSLVRGRVESSYHSLWNVGFTAVIILKSNH